jgi:hypothetical protein
MKPINLFRTLRFILVIVFALSAFPLAAEEQPGDAGSDEDIEEVALLLKLVYIDLRLREEKIAEVPLTAGNYESTEKGVITDRIAVFPGNPILHGRRPNDRRVQLYRGTNKNRILLGTLQVRYYAIKKNIWLPWFKMKEELVLIPIGDDQWLPVSTVPGTSEPMMQTGTSIANAEGFYPNLKFGFGNKRFFLDSWVTR